MVFMLLSREIYLLDTSQFTASTWPYPEFFFLFFGNIHKDRDEIINGGLDNCEFLVCLVKLFNILIEEHTLKDEGVDYFN